MASASHSFSTSRLLEPRLLAHGLPNTRRKFGSGARGLQNTGGLFSGGNRGTVGPTPHPTPHPNPTPRPTLARRETA
eukprot:scaffold519_cov102-Isochrysis_galbana.AAC.5